MLNLVKMAVGIRDLDHLSDRMRIRGLDGAQVSITTRNFPKRASEILDGGSLYWVVGGSMAARHRIVDISEDNYQDGSRCARIEIVPDFVRVVPQKMKPFRGWRYLEMGKTPPDIAVSGPVMGLEALPSDLRRALQELCLI